MLNASKEMTVDGDENWNPNTVLRILGERIGSSKTFGENVIFMLNRAGIKSFKLKSISILIYI